MTQACSHESIRLVLWSEELPSWCWQQACLASCSQGGKACKVRTQLSSRILKTAPFLLCGLSQLSVRTAYLSLTAFRSALCFSAAGCSCTLHWSYLPFEWRTRRARSPFCSEPWSALGPLKQGCSSCSLAALEQGRSCHLSCWPSDETPWTASSLTASSELETALWKKTRKWVC